MPNDLSMRQDTKLLVQGETLALPDAHLVFFRQINLPASALAILQVLIEQTPWKEQTIKFYGKVYKQPRLIAWYGDDGISYRYSGVTHAPLPWTGLLHQLKAIAEQYSACNFNSALVNYYRDHRDSMGMHSDNEAELGPQPIIASLSLGAERTFILKHKNTAQKFTLPLPSGSLLVMQGDTQTFWRHGITKEKHRCAARINVTFRTIIPPLARY
jgi:alkylated DNA repair dioxygenase AlkB